MTTIERNQPRVRRQGFSLRTFLSYGYTRVGLVITFAVVAIVIVGPFVAPYGPYDIVGAPFSEPTSTALLGTDVLGRDVLSRVLVGGFNVLWMATAATLLGVGAGLIVGVTAGYCGGATDVTIMRVVDILLAFPALILVMLVTSLIGPSPFVITLLVALAWLPSSARVMRGATSEVRNQDYVLAAQVNGVPWWRIMRTEVLPNLTSPLMVEVGLRLTWSISLIAALSFLGLGVQPPTADWGVMINENRDGLTVQPLGVIAPASMVALFTIGTSFIAEGLSRMLGGIDRRQGGA
ncbi:ABC transporter permease [Microbacterium deminutum]|uniref:ABC transporter permease n=1 Tax=Microbacterium deminutum TaxID=344164 RepID=A0ABN2RI04_9MICO